MNQPINVLVSLFKGYGLGDAVQMSAVLRHARKYRPHWVMDFQAEPGRESVGRGIAHSVFCYGQEDRKLSHYDAEVQILLYDTWANWHDRPNTRVSSCLHERFGLPWDAECGRYQINVRPEKIDLVRYRWTTLIPGLCDQGRKVIAVHYKGDSSPGKKDLSDAQADKICQHILAMGRVPLLLDWRDVSPLAHVGGICTTGGTYFSREWGGDAEMNCAVIRQCEAFVGIDSGPAKCASSTDVPSLVVWTGHHPAPFHDPAPNTTHLVPVGYHGLEPVCNNLGVIAWFVKNHEVWEYNGDPVYVVKEWLTHMLESSRSPSSLVGSTP